MRKISISNRTIPFFCLLVCSLFFCGCGKQVCDFCGQEKFCQEFDVMGIPRLICRDCLNDPTLAVSGNVARSYAELYENGTLEYPEQSPLRPVDPKEETPTDEGGAPKPDLETILNGYDAEADIRQRLLDDLAREQAQDQPAGQFPQDTPVISSAPSGGASAMSLTELLDAINASLQLDNMFMTPTDGSGTEYILYSGNTDLGIHFKPSMDMPDAKILAIQQFEGASSSDYAKAAIRSVLAYLGSDDYDGLGHEIFNNAVQAGSYKYNDITFSVQTFGAEEIEKGRPATAFIITP